MEFLVILVIFLLFSAFVLLIVLYPMFERKKESNAVINYDSMMRTYIFLLESDKNSVIQALALPNVNDIMKYNFDPTDLTITFMHYNSEIKHQLYFIETGGRTYLKVFRIPLIYSRSAIPVLINSFWIDKIHAVPVSYDFFQSIQQ